MKIRSATLACTVPDQAGLPRGKVPEFALTGRSNVGKSSLINTITGKRNLARTSGKPGKTRLINLYLINGAWHLADLPGYGYARISKQERASLLDRISAYIRQRKQLTALFVLVDGRLPPQEIDMAFLTMLGRSRFPLVVIRTKTDQLSQTQNRKSRSQLERALEVFWEPLPRIIDWSARTGKGRDEILAYIENSLNLVSHRKQHR